MPGKADADDLVTAVQRGYHLLMSAFLWLTSAISGAQFDEEDQEFGEDFLSDEDPSILHFLLASGDEVGPLETATIVPESNKRLSHRLLLPPQRPASPCSHHQYRPCCT